MALLGRLLNRGSSRTEMSSDQELKTLDQLESGEGESSGLLSSDSFVHTLEQSGNTVQAERTSPNSQLNLGIEARVFPATEVEINVPQNHQAGDVLSVQGPDGSVKLILPAGVEPGTVFRHRIKAEPEYRIEVPQGASPGSALTFARADGIRISIAVPPNLRPGDMFDVSPPALMVLVPEGLQPGDYVVFSSEKVPGFMMGGEATQWFRARIPEQLQLGRYFAARLPEPEAPKSSGNGGKLAAFRRAFQR